MLSKNAVVSVMEGAGSVGAGTRRLLNLLGRADKTGNLYWDENGHITTHNPEIKPKECSFLALAEAIIGPNWKYVLTPENALRAAIYESQHPILESESTPAYGVTEAGTNAVTATAFANINAFTAVVAGLLEISVMEGWQNPEFIADQLMPVDPTRMFAGRKVIGLTRLGDVAEPRIPGMPTKRAGFGERWITQPATVENAISVEITQESVYLDLTGSILEYANSVGEWLAYRKEIRCSDAFIGITNTYTFRGTSFNTYISNGAFNNLISGNELTSWPNLETLLVAFRDMKDPDTNTRVAINPNRLLVNMEKLMTANAILGATEAEYRDASNPNSLPQNIRRFNNPVSGKFGPPLQSPYIFQRMTDAASGIPSPGLGLSATVAGKTYFMWEYGKPFKYAQNWPLRLQQAAPNQLDMIDRGIVLFVKADERGVPMVYEPRRIIQSRP